MNDDLEEEGSMNKNAVTVRKTIRVIDHTIDRLLTVLFLIVLFIGSYFIYDSWYVFNSASLDSVPGHIWKGTETLVELPKDAKAWLIIDDTKINCPIMQGKTNEDYLNKNPYGEYSLSGSIFLDAANDKKFTDDYSLLYGHNVSDGYMFGALQDYLNEDYLDGHRAGTLTIRDGDGEGLSSDLKDTPKTTEEQVRADKSYRTVYKVNIFAVMETDANDRAVFDIKSEQNLTNYIKDNALIYREPKGDKILALTTCVDPAGLERIAVFATLTLEDCPYMPVTYKVESNF